jgi:pimeloyl-ACP methyl ester carboxylesterase
MLTLLAAVALQASPAPSIDQSLERYAQPARLVTLRDGRLINLDCRGSGKITVVLFAGLGSWSRTWARVHDRLAQLTRTCAFDPPGYGFSSASTAPQDATHIADDAQAALTAAGITGRYVAVGHSAGGLQALAFTDRRLVDLAGMVLVDTTLPGNAERFGAVAPKMTAFFAKMQAETVATLERCAVALSRGPLSMEAADAKTCFDLRPYYPARLREAMVKAASSPEIMKTRAAHIAAMDRSARAAVRPDRHYGSVPVVVLTRGRLGPLPGPPSGVPEEATEGPAMDRVWVAEHQALAKLSTRGKWRSVPEAGHSIQFDQPDAVVQAVREVLAAATP